MKTLHWNGERWYVNEQSLLKRVRRWFVWFGGWERANGGWQLRIEYATGRKGWVHPTPVSILGHRATFFGHWMQVRWVGGWLVIDWRERHAYISSNGTPNRAHCWLWGVRASNSNLPVEAQRLVLTSETP
jgi:hypothetical protein